MQLLSKRTRGEVKHLLALDFILACLLTLIFPFLEVSPVNNFLFQLYGEKACLTEG